MNVAYTKLLKIGGRLCEVNFRKLTPATYHVDTTDERGNRHMFSMIKSPEGDWRLSSSTQAVWINQAEDLIANAIGEWEASGSDGTS
jgi:hypothetical protein